MFVRFVCAPKMVKVGGMDRRCQGGAVNIQHKRFPHAIVLRRVWGGGQGGWWVVGGGVGGGISSLAADLYTVLERF